MTRFDDRLAEYAIPQKVTEAEQRLENLAPESVERADEVSPDGLNRLGTVLQRTTVITGTSDPEMVTNQQLGGVANMLDQIIAQFQHFESGEVNWDTLEGSVEELLNQLSSWPNASGIPPEEVTEAASRFRRSAGQLLSNLEGEINATKSAVEELRAQADRAQSASEEAIANASSQVNNLESTVTEQKGRLEEAIRENQGQFSEAQEKRGEQFRESVADLESRISKVEADAKQRLDEAEGRFTEEMESAQTRIDEQLADAQRIVGVIATTGIVGGFQLEAKAQKKTADWLRGAAIAVGLGAVGIAIWGVIHAQSDSDTGEILAKALASFVFFGIAGYLATQSGKHREREERARRKELELAAFGPFITDLSPDKQEELVAKLADRMFGHDLPTKSGGDGLTEENVSVVGQLAAILRRTA